MRWYCIGVANRILVQGDEMKLLKPCSVWGMRAFSVLALFAVILFSAPIHAFEINQRIRANSGKANVRNDALTQVLFTQDAGVHGKLVSSKNGTAGGFSGLWWKINWDSEPPDKNGQQGWTAESRISLAPSAGDVPQQTAATLSNHYYTADQEPGLFPDWAPASVGGTLDRFGLVFGNCTWYANGRLRELGYNSTQLDKLVGDAGKWDTQADGAHIDLGSTAAVGSIAQWEPGTQGTDGHVAVVESVNWDDGTITVTESSFSTSASSTWNFLWRHRTISHAEAWPSKFIYVDRPIIAERYDREGGPTGAMGPHYLGETDLGPSQGWNWRYQWFEKGFIWDLKDPSTGETWSYAWSKPTGIWNASQDWVPLGWCEHVGVKTYCYAP